MMERKPWLDHYDRSVPHTLHPYPTHTLLDVVSETARQRPDHYALLFQGTHISYAELERLSDAFAVALVARGIQKGDRVALLLPNCPQFIIAQLGVWKAGAITTPINPLYTESELEYMLKGCEAKTAIVKGRILHPCFLASRIKGDFDILKKSTMLIAEKVLRLQLISFPNNREQFSKSSLRDSRDLNLFGYVALHSLWVTYL